MTEEPFAGHANTGAALEAFHRGYQAITIRSDPPDMRKRPYGTAWERTRWASSEQVRETFDRAHDDGLRNVGLLLGEPSDGLVDIDLDHPTALRLREQWLGGRLATAMMTGHAGRARSHHWYRVTRDLPGTRKYTLPDGSTIIEIRSTGAQTLIPPSTHPTGEAYRWEGQPWGGPDGPREIPGKELVVATASLALTVVLLDAWPQRGGRHEAYLALAGGLLRLGDTVHPYWEQNLPTLIRRLAYGSLDSDGADARVHEVMSSTLERLRGGREATGFTTLGRLIGDRHVERVRRLVADIEAASGTIRRDGVSMTRPLEDEPDEQDNPAEAAADEALPPEEHSPLEERKTTWDAVPLDRYLTGEVVLPVPTLLRRQDGQGLMYAGKVNSLFGRSESAKTWLALKACQQEIDDGGRVLYLDFEDMPETAVDRLRLLSTGIDDIAHNFRYVHPEEPIADLQRYAYRGDQPTEKGLVNKAAFAVLLESFNPSLIVADGMTSLYGLHGHSTNDAGGTDVITTWFKKLTRHGRRTVIVIDHTGKGEIGSTPIGAHHKIAMVQGCALRVDTIEQPVSGGVGTMMLIVAKDRPGAVRKASTKAKEPVAGTAVLDSTREEEKVSTLVIEPPDPETVTIPELSRAALRHAAKESAAAALQERILGLFHDEDWVLTSELLRRAYGDGGVNRTTKDAFRHGWEELVDGDFLERRGEGPATALRVTVLS